MSDFCAWQGCSLRPDALVEVGFRLRDDGEQLLHTIGVCKRHQSALAGDVRGLSIGYGRKPPEPGLDGAYLTCGHAVPDTCAKCATAKEPADAGA